jgi:hypothetical protein
MPTDTYLDMNLQIKNPNQRMFTAQDMADFWAYQVEIGKGNWEVHLCMRGFSLIRKNGRGPSLCVLPEDQVYDKERKLIFLGARDS